jgi:hypothetical protein
MASTTIDLSEILIPAQQIDYDDEDAEIVRCMFGTETPVDDLIQKVRCETLRVNKLFDYLYKRCRAWNTLGTCCICIVEVFVGAVLRCGHVYHNKCVDKWLKQNQTCPMCRAPVRSFIDLTVQSPCNEYM